MTDPVPTAATPWVPMSARTAADHLGAIKARWWLSGGAALDHWLGRQIRTRPNTDISSTSDQIAEFVAALPAGLSAWVGGDQGGEPRRWDKEVPNDQSFRIYDEDKGAWTLQVNAEDGTANAWLYRRDPRLQLPWDKAVLDVDGIPTGAPEVQLVWKALRPRPEDDIDREAILPALAVDRRAWFERTILTVHPHSSWSILARSPSAPARASWNRPRS